ncbi:hypothetical protein AN957_02870 [Cytobacillus solani]|uniref:Uncharacterized protein n=1 Tax=Cytobacillus solani TaxID=1637975 RepID=A0A0Q3U3N9_9BACI|nr:hypothetical protein AN957_02870 [Cytobacillus solani]
MSNRGWKSQQPRQLKKIAYALTEWKLKSVVEAHEERGWVQASEFKKHGYGLGCLMIWGKDREVGI